MAVTIFLFSASFIAEPLVRQVKGTRIKREDFHILKVIGRGTFSEVSRSEAGTKPFKVLNHHDLTKYWLKLFTGEIFKLFDRCVYTFMLDLNISTVASNACIHFVHVSFMWLFLFCFAIITGCCGKNAKHTTNICFEDYD